MRRDTVRSIIEAEQPAVPRRIYPRFARMLRQTPEVGLKILRRLVGTGMAEAAQTKKTKMIDCIKVHLCT